MASKKGWTRGQVIGGGSTATVSIASVNNSGELFAVKSAKLSKSSPLQHEQRILSTLVDCCDNVVSCLGHDISDDGQYNLFLEYAPGGSLSDYVAKRGGRLSERDIRSRTREVLTGLAVLHSREIVHCDVKSQNILIGADGKAKIADLGCAKYSGNEGVQLRGTPMFMAPEVARGECQGMAADIWAVGCVAIEMATGHAPWWAPERTSDDAISVLHRIGFSDEVPEVPGWVSEEGKDFLGKCLRREAGERWTAEELLRHPFFSLMNCANNSEEERKWTSPKSILDHQRSIISWASADLEEEELETDDDEELSTERPLRMIAELISGGGPPSWTWDENWLSVRIDAAVINIKEEEEEHTVDDEDESELVILASRSTASEDRVVTVVNSKISARITSSSSNQVGTDDESVGDDSFRIANILVTDCRLQVGLNCHFVNDDHRTTSNNGNNKNLLITMLPFCLLWLYIWLDQQKASSIR